MEPSIWVAVIGGVAMVVVSLVSQAGAVRVARGRVTPDDAAHAGLRAELEKLRAERDAYREAWVATLPPPPAGRATR